MRLIKRRHLIIQAYPKTVKAYEDMLVYCINLYCIVGFNYMGVP